jgi:transcriptional regulator with GAF, ATPase, and Fis domain
VLKVISRSALDVQKVLDALVESAARLCDADDAAILQVDGSDLRLAAHYGQTPFPHAVGENTVAIVRGTPSGRAVIERQTIHVDDVQAEVEEYPEGRERALRSAWHTALSVPLLRGGEAIGAILIRRTDVRPFTERQIELVNTFADQAVIAIENTRLFEEVQARTRDATEALEYQTATSDVLKVISRSAFDLQAVLGTLVESAVRLCEAENCQIFLREGEVYRLAANHGFSTEHEEYIRQHPVPLDEGVALGERQLSADWFTSLTCWPIPNSPGTNPKSWVDSAQCWVSHFSEREAASA